MIFFLQIVQHILAPGSLTGFYRFKDLYQVNHELVCAEDGFIP